MVLSVKKEKPIPIHHRKRQGLHHRRSKEYDKHYWPYLPLLSIIGVGFVLNSLWLPISQPFGRHEVLDYATNTSIAGLLGETNTQRTANSVPALQLNSQLDAAAQAKAEDMAQRNYWSHTTPDGKEPWWFVTNAGYNYASVGENLAYGFASSSATVTGWMNSTGHRANVLNSDFHDVGFGVANSGDYQGNGNQTIVVAMYGSTLGSPLPTNQIAATKTSANQPLTASQHAPTSTTTPAAIASPTTTPTPSVGRQIISQPTTAAATASPKTYKPSSIRRVARFELLAGSLPAPVLITAFVTLAAAAALFVIRHMRALHKKLVRGERFVVGHPLVDIALVIVITAGILLTRTAGFIR